MDTTMQQRIIFLSILFLVLFISAGDNSYILAQAQNVPRTPSELPLSDPIEAAHDHYHERRYMEAIKAYEALIEKGIPNADGSHTTASAKPKRIDPLDVRTELRQNR